MPLKRAIGFEVKKLSSLLKRQFGNNPVMREVDKMTGMHGWVIGYLFEKQGEDVFQRDIEAEFDIRRSTVSGVLQRMEENGLIRREGVAKDARLKKLVLTEKAVDVHERIVDEIEKMEKKLVQGLTGEEIETFLRLIDKIKHNVE